MVWLKLLRIAALPSALSNILVGCLLASGSWQPATPLVWLLLSSACLYGAGMVLNDVFDVEVDNKERPERPIPSGAVSLDHARNAGFLLLSLGIFLALFASKLGLLIALGLAISIYLYDGPLKRTFAAPFVMGLCRFLNILLGASAATELPMMVIAYAASIGIFIAGVTWLAKREAVEQQSINTLLPGSMLMIAGLGVAAMTVAGTFSSHVETVSDAKVVRVFLIAFAFVCLPILRRLFVAITTASSSAVQITVVTSLRSLIVFDACIALTVESGRPLYSLVILGLLGVSWLWGKASKLT